MSSFFKTVCMILALIMSCFVVGDPEGFKTTVEQQVTTQTEQITVHMENRTGDIVYDPCIQSLEVCIDEEWISMGHIVEHLDISNSYNPLQELNQDFHLNNLGIYETLDKGEYRVVISFSLKEKNKFSDHISYAYFTII